VPIIKSAIKRMKQTAKRRERNVGIKRDIKSASKAFYAKPSAATLAAAHSEIDTAVKKGLIKKQTAARRKSNLSRAAKNLGVKLAKTATPKTAATTTTTKKPAAKATTTKKAPAKAAAKKPATKTTTTKKPATKKPAAKK
jgi:ribosomal protein S20